MAGALGRESDYVFGSSEQEYRRLEEQAAILCGWTRRYFDAAGLSRGMRVLDVGCGMGDVSFLAAEFVAPSGSVTGIDRDPEVVQAARRRMEQKNVTAELTFEHADLRDYSAGQDFDAVVGRYVLLYQPDPAAALRHLVEQLRPGGLILFHELDFGAPIKTWPPAPLWDRSISLAGEAFRRAGIPPDFGLRLSRTFLDAGLSRPTIQADVPTGGEPGSYVYGWLAGVLRTLLPRIEQFGLATAEELQIDTLRARLRAEAVTCGCQLIGPIQFGAWIRRQG